MHLNYLVPKEPSEFDENIISIIHKNYENSMNKRRPGSALNIESFSNHICHHAYSYMYGKSYVFGNIEEDLLGKEIFQVSHFAPASNKEGVNLLKSLRKYNNVVFAVSIDLKPMLEKIGYFSSEETKVLVKFRSEMVEKYILTSSYELLEDIINLINPNKKKEKNDLINSQIEKDENPYCTEYWYSVEESLIKK